MNDVDPAFSEDALVELVLGVAQGQISKSEAAQFLAENSRTVLGNS
jgi:hypothetical protein